MFKNLSRIEIIYVLICCFFVVPVLALGASSHKSPTCDEYCHHTASGYSHLLTRDFRMNPAMPPLPRLLSALPIALSGAHLPLEHASWVEGNSPEFARQFFNYPTNDQDRIIFLARLLIAFMGGFFVLTAYLWARSMFGVKVAVITSWLCAFSPDVLAHSGLATSDMTVSLFFTLTLYRFWQYLNKPKSVNLTKTALALGLCFLSKYSAILLLPLMLTLGLVTGKRKLISPVRILKCIAVMLLVIWMGYFFEVKPLLKNTPDPPKKIAFLEKIGGQSLVQFAEHVPVPLASFTTSLGSMFFTRAKGTHAYLMGQWSDTGWWYYYFCAIFFKQTLPVLILFFAGIYLLRRFALRWLDMAFLLIPPIFFFLVTMPDRAQAGIRYFLPIYPNIMMLGALTATYFLSRWKKVGLAVVVLLLVWHAERTMMIYPDFIPHFNELVGGPIKGKELLRDSNIDWGQDLKGVGQYLEKVSYDKVVLFSHSPSDPAYYGIRYRPIREDEFDTPGPFIYVLGVHNIDAVKWYRAYEPTAIIGYSMYIYDLRKQDKPSKTN